MATRYIDLNCDMGESFGRWTLGADAEIMPFITSANIACGFHGGDPHVMRQTVELALRHGVAIGAHPGLSDLMGFGRRRMDVSPQEVRDYIVYQTGALREVVALAWDSRSCAWAAQDASGYDRELSPGENDVVNFFVHGLVGGPAGREGDGVGAARAESPAAAVDASAAGRPALGRGGRKNFDQVYLQCMTKRGYELSRRGEEQAR